MDFVVIREVVQVPILEGAHRKFEKDLEMAVDVILPHVKGFIELVNVGWCLERPSIYMFIIDWETLEDHMVDFRESEQFTQWRTLIDPHFAGAPIMEHFTP